MNESQSLLTGRDILAINGINRPQYRLRIGEIRVFFDVVGQAVEVLAIVPKPEAAAWLEEVGERE